MHKEVLSLLNVCKTINVGQHFWYLLELIKFTMLRFRYFSFFILLTRKEAGYTEFLWSFVKFSNIKACHAGWWACSASAPNNVQLAQIRKKPVRTNWNNLLVARIFLTTHPLSLLHPAFLLYSTTSSRQLKTEQPLWFLYPKIKRLWRGDCWPVRTWCIIHSYTITSSQPVTVSLSRSLTGLQLISPNPRHSPQSQDQLFAGMFCTKVFLLRYQQKPVFYHQSQCCQYLSVAPIAKKSQLVRIMWLRQGAANTNNPIFEILGNKWYDSFDKLKRKLWTCIECRECEIELKYIRVQDGVWS